MLNFTKVKENFETHALDILKYEVYYHKDDEVIFDNFVDRMNGWISLSWSRHDCDIKYNIEDNIILMKVQFKGEIPFGFEYCFDLNIIKLAIYIV